ncbi:MAG: hypothetical protein U0350_10460 [Caldilineaceae bacterium]
MTIATETLTIHLPVQAAHRLRRVAEIAQRSIDEVISDTLQSNLPPLLEDVPPAFRAELGQLETWSNDALRQQVFATFDSANSERYEDLLAAKATGPLSDSERKELSDLRNQADLLMYRKVYAALLLKWRGERVPTLAEMEAN